VFAAQIAPPHRRAESLGTIGLAGFLGLVLGPTLGDFIFSGQTTSILPYRVFFSASAVCSLAAGMIMLRVRLASDARAGASAGSAASGGTVTGPAAAFRVILAHWPGMILLVGLCFSMAYCIQMVFLERLAEAQGFQDIKIFFLLYAPTAMTLRVLLRRMPERVGRERTVLIGLVLMAGGILCLTGIQSQYELILPGLLMGAGHSLIFPSMVDLAAGSLPASHRGTGTALILGSGDLGFLIGFATLGEVIDRFGFDVALSGLAGALLLSGILFGITCRLGFASQPPRDRAGAS